MRCDKHLTRSVVFWRAIAGRNRETQGASFSQVYNSLSVPCSLESLDEPRLTIGAETDNDQIVRSNHAARHHLRCRPDDQICLSPGIKPEFLPATKRMMTGRPFREQGWVAGRCRIRPETCTDRPVTDNGCRKSQGRSTYPHLPGTCLTYLCRCTELVNSDPRHNAM